MKLPEEDAPQTKSRSGWQLSSRANPKKETIQNEADLLRLLPAGDLPETFSASIGASA